MRNARRHARRVAGGGLIALRSNSRLMDRTARFRDFAEAAPAPATRRSRSSCPLDEDSQASQNRAGLVISSENTVMDVNSIRNALRAVPFQPFELHLADGRRIPVMHPEFVAMNQRIVIVTDEESATKIIEPLLIVSLEPLPGTDKGGNGAGKKKPKS